MNKKTLAIVIAIVVALLLLPTIILVFERVSFVGKARETATEVWLENSYVFASPLTAQGNGKEKIRITVFILNNQGLGIAGKLVLLTQNNQLKVDGVQGVTDSLGRAFFDVSSDVAGEYLIEALVDGRKIPQTVKVSFR